MDSLRALYPLHRDYPDGYDDYASAPSSDDSTDRRRRLQGENTARKRVEEAAWKLLECPQSDVRKCLILSDMLLSC